ncbi:MAG: hypothetical protein KAS04_01555 [Candidatus Aenigmarchaeota archaeon]|nr:hypothetical protein [Candidatus Aenigmarchaeota archaeon]
MTIHYKSMPYYVLLNKRILIQNAISKHNKQNKDDYIDIDYIVEDHLKRLEEKEQSFTEAMKILEENGFGLTTVTKKNNK